MWEEDPPYIAWFYPPLWFHPEMTVILQTLTRFWEVREHIYFSGRWNLNRNEERAEGKRETRSKELRQGSTFPSENDEKIYINDKKKIDKRSCKGTFNRGRFVNYNSAWNICKVVMKSREPKNDCTVHDKLHQSFILFFSLTRLIIYFIYFLISFIIGQPVL